MRQSEQNVGDSLGVRTYRSRSPDSKVTNGFRTGTHGRAFFRALRQIRDLSPVTELGAYRVVESAGTTAPPGARIHPEDGAIAHGPPTSTPDSGRRGWTARSWLAPRQTDEPVEQAGVIGDRDSRREHADRAPLPARGLDLVPDAPHKVLGQDQFNADDPGDVVCPHPRNKLTCQRYSRAVKSPKEQWTGRSRSSTASAARQAFSTNVANEPAGSSPSRSPEWASFPTSSIVLPASSLPLPTGYPQRQQALLQLADAEGLGWSSPPSPMPSQPVSFPFTLLPTNLSPTGRTTSLSL